MSVKLRVTEITSRLSRLPGPRLSFQLWMREGVESSALLTWRVSYQMRSMPRPRKCLKNVQLRSGSFGKDLNCSRSSR